MRPDGKACRDAGLTGRERVDSRREIKDEKAVQKRADRWNPEKCPCKKTSCERYKNCEACKEYHSTRKRPPYCER